jgi:hypothetical protein
MLPQGYMEDRYHSVNVDTNSFVSSVCFYRVKSGNFEMMKKQVLLR